MPPHISSPDLALYANRWVALVKNQVAGVGITPDEAINQARRNRPKERFQLRFVENATGGKPLNLSPILKKIQTPLEKTGLPVYLVGGAVRDGLLGNISHDLDFVLPQQGIKTTFAVGDYLRQPAYPLDKKRDTGRVVLQKDGVDLDFSVFRGHSLLEDLEGRDFTVNAIAMPASATHTNSLIDPLNGYADLKAKQLRLTNPNAIKTDPIRALRAIRMAIKFDLTILPETAKAIKDSAGLLPASSSERVRNELLKILQSKNPAQAIAWMSSHHLLPHTLPEIAALAPVTQSPPHHEAVLAHTISVLRWVNWLQEVVLWDEVEGSEKLPASVQQALAEAANVLAPYRAKMNEHFSREAAGQVNGWQLLRWGALWHDAGKAVTQTIAENGRIRFLGHEEAGQKLAQQRLIKLHFSNEAAKFVGAIARGHMRPLLLASENKLTRRAVFRFFRKMGNAGIDICLLSLADHLATYGIDKGESEEGVAPWKKLRETVHTLLDGYFNHLAPAVRPPSLVNGKQLMEALALAPGPEVGRLLRLIEEAHAAGEISTFEEALALAQNS